MPLGAVHAASVEDKMRSECSKGSGENFYSTGFGEASATASRLRRRTTARPTTLNAGARGILFGERHRPSRSGMRGDTRPLQHEIGFGDGRNNHSQAVVALGLTCPVPQFYTGPQADKSPVRQH